jgi:hypothetical protein
VVASSKEKTCLVVIQANGSQPRLVQKDCSQDKRETSVVSISTALLETQMEREVDHQVLNQDLDDPKVDIQGEMRHEKSGHELMQHVLFDNEHMISDKGEINLKFEVLSEAVLNSHYRLEELSSSQENPGSGYNIPEQKHKEGEVPSFSIEEIAMVTQKSPPEEADRELTVRGGLLIKCS